MCVILNDLRFKLPVVCDTVVAFLLRASVVWVRVAAKINGMSGSCTLVRFGERKPKNDILLESLSRVKATR